MSKLKLYGGLFATFIGGLLILSGLLGYLDSGEVGFWIAPLIFGVPTLVGGLLGLASRVTAGGILVSIVAGFYILLIIMNMTPALIYPGGRIFSLIGIVLAPSDVTIPLDSILIILSGILLLKSVNEVEG